MREMASLAASFTRGRLPASLMQRLALMQHYARLATAQANGHNGQAQLPGQRASRRSAHAVVLAWFSLGVLTSGAMGFGAIVGLRALASGATPTAGAAWAKTPAVASWSHSPGEWEAAEVTIDRSQRANAPLALQVAGADDGAFEVVLHGLPTGVRPSRGAPLGETTWVLEPGDLDGLYLTLDETAPEAFEVKIGVSTSPGVVTAGSIVEVRLVDTAARKQGAMAGGSDAPPPAYAGMSDGPGTDVARQAPAYAPGAARAAAARGDDKVGGQTIIQKRPVPPLAGSTKPSSQPASTGRSWPEGAYGLGAAPREPEQAKSWWQTPPPSWSPFLVGQERP